MIGIYKITSPSGRIYIGQSRDIAKRFNDYKSINNSKEQIKLHRSFLKYGYDNHVFEIIEECLFKNLNIRERYYQDFYNVLKNGLNCILVQTDELPLIFSIETREKISKANKGRKHSEEAKLKITNSKLGKKLSEEHKLKLSLIHKNKILSEEHVNNIRRSIEKHHPGSKPIINIETNEIFETIKDAAESINMKSNTLVCKLNGRNKNNTSMRYYEK